MADTFPKPMKYVNLYRKHMYTTEGNYMLVKLHNIKDKRF